MGLYDAELDQLVGLLDRRRKAAAAALASGLRMLAARRHSSEQVLNGEGQRVIGVKLGPQASELNCCYRLVRKSMLLSV